ncbi:hypothetical protein BC827DRAFT_532861 [Russula dissimulans]|nr:hypothetical protein BC827DRAFT_532861 [Russula dissimulans]
MAIGKAAKWISFAASQQSSASSSAAHDTVHSTLSIADEKQFGLENFGNTCYANSVLQTLYFCSPFRDLVIQSADNSAPPVPATVSRPPNPPLLTPSSVLPRRKSERGKPAPDVPSAPATPTLVIPSAPPTLFSALRSLYVYISKNPADKGAVAPRAFIDKLRDANEHFRGVMHQDAHEFLNYLLNKIVEEIQSDKHHKDKDKDSSSSNASGEDLSSSVTLVSNNAATLTANSDCTQQSGTSGTLVHRLFEGTLTSETRCLTCETVSSRDESFLDLSIDIEQNSSVTACLRQFSASEMLCQRNKFFCDSCCGLQEAEKRMKIKKLPNILALHLKRFKYQEDLKKYIKLAYRVAFPFELRLFNTIDDVEDPDRLYELFGIVVHIGSGPHHGHYVAIVKGPQSWLLFDDDKIEPIKESEIPRYFGDATSGSAYVLYYQAVDLDLASLGIKTPAQPAVPDITVADSPANETATSGALSFEAPDLTLPPGLGESSAPSPIAAPTVHPPIPVTPSSPSLVTMPLADPITPPSRKKSLPSIRIPGTSEFSGPSVTTPSRFDPQRQTGLSPCEMHPRMCPLSHRFPCSSSTERKGRRKRKVRRRRGKRNGPRKSLIANQVCGSDGGASNRQRTTGKRRRRKIPRAKTKSQAQLLRMQLWPRHHMRLRPLQCLLNLMERLPCQAQVPYGVVVAHVLTTASSILPRRTAAQHLVKQMPRQPHWHPALHPRILTTTLITTITTTTITIIITMNHRFQRSLQPHTFRPTECPLPRLPPPARQHSDPRQHRIFLHH